MLINTLKTRPKAKYAAADTETHTYIDSHIVPQNTIKSMMNERDKYGEMVYPVQWWREHTRVEVWAYIVYTPDGYFIGDTWEEFSRFLAAFGISTVWWYNAPFDFAATDAAKLQSGWTYVTGKDAENVREYSELANEYGIRYSMKEVHPFDQSCSVYSSKKDKHVVMHYDARNLMKGGLEKLLESFDVRDADGSPIRKGKMDYQAAGVESLSLSDLRYMIDDARGLWWLIDAFGRTLASDYGVEIRGKKPQVLTASGLAKKLLLRKMYPNAKTDHGRLKMYHNRHPIGLQADLLYRRMKLVSGGLVMVNPRYKGKLLTGIEMHRYDYNNHYGAVMAQMRDIVGYPTVWDGRCARENDTDIRLFEIGDLQAFLRDGYIASWNDQKTREISDIISWWESEDDRTLMFDFELEELENWYKITTIDIKRTWFFKTQECPAYADYVNEHYAKKRAAKVSGDVARHEIEKLLNNGAAGKFMQNPNHAVMSRTMCDDGVVRYLINVDENGEEVYTADENSLMSVIQGAYITARARTILRRSCRRIAFLAGKTVSECIVYTDTDSIHTTVPFLETNNLELGWLKEETKTPIRQAIFVAPKTYAEYAPDSNELEIHCKGVRKECLYAAWDSGEPLDEIYRVGRQYYSDSAINVQGGKAILPFPKCVAKKKVFEEEIAT